MPPPARIAVFPSPQGSKAMPARGAYSNPLLLRRVCGYVGSVLSTLPVKLNGPTNCPIAPGGSTSDGLFGFSAQLEGLFFEPAEQSACWEADKLENLTG